MGAMPRPDQKPFFAIMNLTNLSPSVSVMKSCDLSSNSMKGRNPQENVKISVGDILRVKRRPLRKKGYQFQFRSYQHAADADLHTPENEVLLAKLKMRDDDPRLIPEEARFAKVVKLVCRTPEAGHEGPAEAAVNASATATATTTTRTPSNTSVLAAITVEMFVPEWRAERFIPRLPMLEKPIYNMINIPKMKLRDLMTDSRVRRTCSNPEYRRIMGWIVQHKDPVLALEYLRLRDPQFFNFTQHILGIIQPGSKMYGIVEKKDIFEGVPSDERILHEKLPPAFLDWDRIGKFDFDDPAEIMKDVNVENWFRKKPRGANASLRTDSMAPYRRKTRRSRELSKHLQPLPMKRNFPFDKGRPRPDPGLLDAGLGENRTGFDDVPLRTGAQIDDIDAPVPDHSDHEEFARRLGAPSPPQMYDIPWTLAHIAEEIAIKYNKMVTSGTEALNFSAVRAN